MRIFKFSFLFVLLLFTMIAIISDAAPLQPLITDILNAPNKFVGKEVSVSGFYSGWKNAPGAPPVSRSDWVISNSAKQGIYCVGRMPQDDETGEMLPYWKAITVKASVMLSKHDKTPYLKVISWDTKEVAGDTMVSIFQIIVNPKQLYGQPVSIMGVLAKGYGVKGDRMYLLADPTGVLKLGRLPKLYPKGTILHLRGYVSEDENKLPMLDGLEILSARVE